MRGKIYLIGSQNKVKALGDKNTQLCKNAWYVCIYIVIRGKSRINNQCKDIYILKIKEDPASSQEGDSETDFTQFIDKVRGIQTNFKD